MMKPSSRYHFFGVMLFCVLEMFPFSRTLAAPPRPLIPVAIKSSLVAERELAMILDDWQSGRFEAVIEDLIQFRKKHRRSLVSVGPGRLLQGELVFDLLALQLPFETKRSLRKEFFGGDVISPLAQFANPRQVPELLAAADVHWQQGNIDSAVQTWLILASDPLGTEIRLPRWRLFSSDVRTAGEALARLILADITCHRLESARQRLKLFQQQYAQLEGRLAGREGPWGEILAETIRDAENWPREQFYNQNSADWLPGEDVRLDLTQQLWTVPLDQLSPRTDNAPVPPQSQTLVVNDVVLLADAQGVRALSLSTGQSAWPYDDQEPGFLVEENQLLPIRDNNPGEKTVRPISKACGFVLNERWIGCVGGRLICLDLAAEGRMEWAQQVSNLFPGEAQQGGIIAGNLIPLGQGDEFAVPVHSSGAHGQARLVARRGDGKPLWETDAVGLMARPEQSQTVLSDSLTVDRGFLFWNLNSGTVIAVDAESGKIRWSTQTAQQDFHMRDAPVGSGILADLASIYALGSGTLTCLESASGAIRWRCDFPASVTELLGVCDGVVIASGRQLWGIDALTGKTLWQVGGGNPQSQGWGRGLCRGRSIFWPTRSQLWTVDALSGELHQRDAIQLLTGHSGGNLTLLGETLLITSEHDLTAYRVHLHAQF